MAQYEATRYDAHPLIEIVARPHLTHDDTIEALKERLRSLEMAANNFGCEQGSDRWHDILAYELAIEHLKEKTAR